jgi:hypothetical protein
MIVRTVMLLVSPRAQLYFVHVVFPFALDIVREGNFISLFSAFFDRRHFAMVIASLRFSALLLLWVF